MPAANPVILETERLRLVRCTVRQLQKLVEGPETFTGAFGHSVADGYRGFPEALQFSLEKLSGPNLGADWWAPFLFIRREDEAIVGLGRFKGPPSLAGIVEFGYAIAPSCRRQGFATEAARALVKHAFITGRVTVARAHTLPEPSASTRVLEKCGFHHVCGGVDPEHGPVWRWERSR